MATRSCHIEVAKGRQDVNYVEVLRMSTPDKVIHKLRIRIRSDSYRFQCWAVIERWDGNQWHEVYRIDPHVMMTNEGLAYREGYNAGEHFATDRRTLIAIAEDILDA